VSVARLKDLFDRQRRALLRRPSFGRASGQARIRMIGELACSVEQGESCTVVDLPVSEGGGAGGPPPDQMVRAGLGASLAIGYRLWGARLGVDVDAVEIDVVCESDTRGELGIAEEVPAGWQRILIDVRIRSAASEAEVRQLVETADRLSPMLANLSPRIVRVHRLTVGPKAPTERAVPSEVTPLD
jgi:uncharacterized OsmC-like protein